MLDIHDLKSINQANKTMTQLLLDLEKFKCSSNVLLAELGFDMYQKAQDLEQRLKRIHSLSICEEQQTN